LLLGSSAVLDTAAQTAKPAKPIDLSKLPAGTIIVIGEEGKDALQYPGAVVVSPEKFKEMMADLERFKRQANPDKPEAPSRLRLSGEVKENVLHLKAQYEFETRKPRQLIALGGQKASPNTTPAWPTAVTLDEGKLPLLPPPGEDGLVVQVETPGTHKLTLELEMLVSPRTLGAGTGYGIELGLPRAAITILDNLDLPGTARDVTVNGRPHLPRELHSGTDKHRTVPLGAADRLDVVWKGPAPQPGQPSLTATGAIDVQIDEGFVTTTAVLTLQTRGGPTAVWQIQTPPQSMLEVIDLAANDPRAPAAITPPPDRGTLWTIRLKETSDKDLKVRVRHRQAKPEKSKYKVAIGPFTGVNVAQQSGTILVSAPAELRPRIAPRPDLRQHEVPEELRRGPGSVHFYHYWLSRADQVTPLMDIEIEQVNGAVESETTYRLRLTEDGWHMMAEFSVNPVRSVVETVQFDVPADYVLKASPASHVDSENLELKDAVGGRRVGIVKLVAKQRQRFTLKLEGTCAVPKGAPPMFVGLPRPLQTTDKGARLTVTVPEGQELVAARDIGTETLPPGKRDRTWNLDKSPPRLDLSWRERRAELPVDALVDVTLTEQRALVRQRIRFLVAPEPGKEVVLRAADFPAGQAPVVGGVPLVSRGAGLWPVPLKDASLTLEYSVPLPEQDRNRTRRLTVPLFWPEGASRSLTRVRVWSDASTQPLLNSGAWEEMPIDLEPERDTLPALVLRATNPDVPLVLRLVEPAGSPLAALAVDRVLVQAGVIESGQQSYRARFLLTKLTSRYLDIELPGPPATLQFEAFLNKRQVTSITTVDEDGREAETGRIARLRLEPDLYRGKPAVLDVRYEVPPGRTDVAGRLQTLLVPPRLRGNVFPGRVRWQVALPPDWVVAYTGGRTTVEQRWGWRGSLPAPRPASSALDLERWFEAGTEPGLWSADPKSDQPAPSADLVCWQATLEPLPLIHATQQTWLLACSLAFLALGLVLYFAPLPRTLFWSIIGLLIVAVAALAVVSPGSLPILAAGCMPGVIVLLLVIGAQLLLQHRYRRQVVFMSGFTRMAPGSSIVRGNSSQRRRGDPSTVDVPPGALPS